MAKRCYDRAAETNNDAKVPVYLALMKLSLIFGIKYLQEVITFYALLTKIKLSHHQYSIIFFVSAMTLESMARVVPAPQSQQAAGTILGSLPHQCSSWSPYYTCPLQTTSTLASSHFFKKELTVFPLPL